MRTIDPITDATVHRFALEVSGRYDVHGIILYGSRARGTHNVQSDADVAVIFNGEHRRLLAVVFELSDIAFDIMLDTGVRISPLPIWLDEWLDPQSHPNPHLLSNIAKDGIRL